MKKLLLLLLFAPFIFLSCSKEAPIPKPKAEFTFTIGTNGQVYFKNVSTDANSYNWEFGDFTTSTEKELIHTYTRNSTFQVSLTATGNGGTDVIVKSITVNNIKGSVVFYKGFSTGSSNISISVDGTYQGALFGNRYYTSSPNCGDFYGVTVSNLSEGVHSFSGKELNGPNYYTWSGTFTITGGKCSSKGLVL